MSELQPGGAGNAPEGRGPAGPEAVASPQTPGATAAPRSAAASGRPGRPPRTTNGLVGALVVSLLAFGAFVALRAVSRRALDLKPQAVDYLAAAGAAHDAGRRVVYPERLPRGWIATSVDYVPGDRAAWGVGMLTGPRGDFVGVRQEDAPLDDLLATYVDENPVKGPKVQVPHSVAPTWQEYSDTGGDHAFAAEVHGDEVLVYGSAPVEDLRRVLGLLTDARP